jgi:hypothetical protein
MYPSVSNINQIAIVPQIKRLPSQRPGSHSSKLKTKSVRLLHVGLLHSMRHYIPQQGPSFMFKLANQRFYLPERIRLTPCVYALGPDLLLLMAYTKTWIRDAPATSSTVQTHQ